MAIGWLKVWAAISAVAIAATGGSAAFASPSAPDTADGLRAEAFEAAQWAIASDAADALAKMSARFAQGDDALGRLADERETLVGRRDALERDLERLYAAEDAEARGRRTAIRVAYEETVRRLAEVDADIERRFPAYSDLTSPRALGVAETQALLGPDEALLLVLVNPEATYVWGLTHDRIAWSRAADLTETEVTRSVAALRASLTTEASRSDDWLDPALLTGRPVVAFDQAVSYRLYEQLVQPVESVFQGKTTLITVVTGALTTLPLSVLTTAPTEAGADLADAPWLIDRYALASLPAVSSLKALRCHLVADATRRSPGCAVTPGMARPSPGPTDSGPTRPYRATGAAAFSLAAFGAPDLAGAPQGGSRGSPAADSILGNGRLADVAKLKALPYLPGSKAELDALKRRYPGGLVRTGGEATETAVRLTDADALSRARFVVFSTHGLMAGSSVAEPGLVLTPPEQATETDDGYLAASEAARLRLSAEFVVLSACNTAASDGRPGGEGLSGLARAFFFAGARSILVSHWEVSDAATTELIADTFAALDAPGADIGDRARALQHGMMAVRGRRAWSHPAYWAPFTLVGAPN